MGNFATAHLLTTVLCYPRSEFKRFIKKLMGEGAYNTLSSSKKTALVDEFIAKKEWFEDVEYHNTIALRLPADVSCPRQRGGFLSIERFVPYFSV